MRIRLHSKRMLTTVWRVIMDIPYITDQEIEPVDQYLQTFNWNKVKYRQDKPIVELVDSLRKVYSSSLYIAP